MKNQVLETVVSPQDLLKEDMKSIKGGVRLNAGISCNPKGKVVIRCKKNGEVKEAKSISAW